MSKGGKNPVGDVEGKGDTQNTTLAGFPSYDVDGRKGRRCEAKSARKGDDVVKKHTAGKKRYGGQR